MSKMNKVDNNTYNAAYKKAANTTKKLNTMKSRRGGIKK